MDFDKLCQGLGKGELEPVYEWIKTCEDINQLNSKGQTILIAAAQAGNSKLLLDILCREDPFVDFQIPEQGTTALHGH